MEHISSLCIHYSYATIEILGEDFENTGNASMLKIRNRTFEFGRKIMPIET